MSIISSNRVKVVTIGGGTGSSILLRGLKRYSDRINITAIVTTFDDGGSSGRLRHEFGVPALGDIRRCIAALLPEERSGSTAEWILEHRFTSEGPLNNHSLGNLMLLGIWQRTDRLFRAVENICESLELLGRVIPISDELSDVCATLPDGTVIRGECEIGCCNQELFGPSRISLNPPVSANPAALEALRAAQVVILGPGDLFTSVIPNLLPTGVVDALQQSSALILQVCNIAAKRGETFRYAASDFATTANFYINQTSQDRSCSRLVHAMIVNEFMEDVPQSIRTVEADQRLNDIVRSVIVRPVADAANPRNHDPVKLASAVMEYVDKTVSRR